LEPDPDHTGEGKRSSFQASEDAAVESKFFPLRIKTRIRHSRLFCWPEASTWFGDYKWRNL